MEIIPAMDIIDGRCVRLIQGDYAQKTIYNENPLEVAKQFEDAGLSRLHLVDLDGAKASHIVNHKTLKAITSQTKLKVDFGGGIKSDEDITIAFDSGAQQITAGSVAVKSRETVIAWLEKYGSERIILGADVKGEMIALNGWQEKSSINLFSFLNDYVAHGIQYVICTDISKDGMLQGSSVELYKKILEEFPSLKLIASGGVSDLNELQVLSDAGLHGAIIGKAIYENRISLKQLSNFNRETKSPPLRGGLGGALAKRIIPCLDIKEGRTVKGVNFENLRDAGDPVELAKLYADEGADELVFLDITATHEKRKTLIALVERVAAAINIPFTVGGGISSVDDVYALLQSGADKISLNSAAVRNPKLISDISGKFGSQCLVLAIDAKEKDGKWNVYLNGGRLETEMDLFEWAKEGEQRGAGEILFTSMNHDGTKNGFANEALARISETVNIPVIASGGAGAVEHFYDTFTQGKADAALAASIFHFKEIAIRDLKNYLHQKGITIRL
jgi:cyclase